MKLVSELSRVNETLLKPFELLSAIVRVVLEDVLVSDEPVLVDPDIAREVFSLEFELGVMEILDVGEDRSDVVVGGFVGVTSWVDVLVGLASSPLEGNLAGSEDVEDSDADVVMGTIEIISGSLTSLGVLRSPATLV